MPVRRPPRPVLLGLVLGIFLVVVAVTAMAQAILVSAHFSTAYLSAVVASDSATVRTFANEYLRPADLTGSVPAARQAEIEQHLASIVARDEILAAEIRDPSGRVLFASAPGLAGATPDLDADFPGAADGGVRTAILDPGQATGTAATLDTASVLRTYLPISRDGSVEAVVGLWRDADPILARLDEVRRSIVLVTLTAAAIVAILLVFVFSGAQRRISRQTQQLLDAERRDPLTGLPNHGALVGALAEAIETAHPGGRAISVALLDLDNFRLLNDTYGHANGDRVLVQLADVLDRELPDGALVGRYGPDEFLVAAPGTVAALEPVIGRVRTVLAGHDLVFGESERLPISISAGLCSFPEDASSVTALLSAAAITVAEAKASGGDAIRIAGRTPADAVAVARTFDVFQGLILAVDTKDRYTKRHSEDVSRYGAFLARRIGLPESEVAAIRSAGLLHDVGKIGIPDVVLRKPGRLTSEEYEIVKQHVALGDAIVRDLPDIEAIRAGIRYHHERWDGRGYLAGLDGEEIPLVARILAIGDAFSAMTTTRPYRKALDVREALVRLEDAAGSQLDERLVVAFVEGLETAADAPLPGRDDLPAAAWVPSGQVA